jgi:hypothetical protein
MVGVCAIDLFKAGQPEKQNVTARRFPPPWTVEDIGYWPVLIWTARHEQPFVVFFP